MKQQLIALIGNRAVDKFTKQVNELMAEGWVIIPETFRLDTHRKISCDNDVDICGCVVVKMEEEAPPNELMALLTIVQEKLAALENQSCSCSDVHDGPTPPPHFESPDQEPTDPSDQPA